jgi:SAM-dependent methyltransferase
MKKGHLWRDYELTEEDIRKKHYRKVIGSGEDWDGRGLFQLKFLKYMLLMPEHKVLDIGCGPLRAGVHFIKYLNSENYFGFDYNRDFVKAANYIITQDPALSDKWPKIFFLEDFNIADMDIPKCDYGIAFSVLNHCTKDEIKLFFKNVPLAFKTGARIFVIMSNSWFEESMLKESKFEFVHKITKLPQPIIETFGKRTYKSLLGILEFTI